MLAQLITLNNQSSESLNINKAIFKIGRDPTNDKQLLDNKVSSFHLSIELDEMQFTLIDNSSNGTFLNGKRIGKGNKVIIRNGDIIHILPVEKVQKNEIIGFQFITEKITDSRLNSDKITSKSQLNNNQQKDVNDEIQYNNHNDYIDELGDELQCNICNDYLFEAVTINPCNHHFCGACLSNWLGNQKQHNDCPNCRTKIKSIMIARLMNNLVEKWLKNNPSQKRADSLIDKMKQENIIYKNPNYYLNFEKEYKQNEQIQQNDYEEFLSNDENFDDNNPDFQQNEILNPNNFLFVQAFNPQLFNPLIQQQQQVVQPIQTCKSCNGQVWKQYQCHDIQIHIGCSSCGRLIPKRLLNDEENEQLQMFCCICKVYDCKFYYGDCTKANLNKLMLVKDIGNNFQIPLNFINDVEYNRILNHLQGKQHNIIYEFMMEHYINKGDFYFEQNKSTFNFPLQDINVKITPNTPVCWQCHKKLMNFIIFRYVQCWKYDEALFSSTDCFYGINCRTQHRNKFHANKYNHVCEQTKFD
ncbi:unnamed protein product [Paramecium sonneborni]|uniref:E3 ubiquitin-protein ligase CHFR n=1 Tax=Paramecium sonneborni TaxID=65129 RepID=A0A8S1RL50_9CILI|nr:unnamed protein product [Paramecium sonneborni]